MEPDVIRMYSSSPPPLDDGAEDDDDDFGDFGAFSGVPSSVSFTEFDTPPVSAPPRRPRRPTPRPQPLRRSWARGPAGRGPSGLPCVSASDPQGADSSAGLEGRPAVKTVSAEELKRPADHAPRGAHSNSSEPEPGGGRTKADAHSCNGRFAADEVLTNGFVAFDGEDGPSCPSPDHPANKGTAPSTPDSSPANTEDEFDDFSAFGGAGAPRDAGSEQVAGGGRADEGKRLADGVGDERSDPGEAESVAEENGVRDSHSPRPDAADVPAVVTETLSNGDRGSLSDEETERRDADSFSERPDPADVSEQSGAPVIQNGNGRGREGAENEVGVSVSESFASFCQAVSPDGTEDFGDFSVPGLAPSACPEEETLTPADPSWPTEEEEEEDFGDFGDASSVSGPGFADFDRTESEQPAESADSARDSGEDEGDFGDFSAPQEDGAGEGTVGGEGFAEFPAATAADFSAAPRAPVPTRSAAPSEGQARLQDSAPVTAPPADGSQTCRRDSLSVSLACRLERLFHTSFPDTPTPEYDQEVLTLRVLLDPPSRPEEDEEEAEEGGEAGKDTPAPHEDLGRVWRQLLEIHDALGLRYQWGGSHSNKALLCSLGIDTRNILFTGQKKQPVIVPMYAASLGMLEPTKEPMSEMSSPDPGQEALPPVQFDWSSSGLTNPLDASGGSCLLNLDFFGPVDDSSSSSATSIPGVDPELYELTTAKMDTGNTGSRIADAFARLMSTVEKTSTSTRKPKKEENLSEEAAKVIAGLPDLSFMQAKILP
ncbi:hypothetical protein ANANG_G00051070 [Anguilla anguilla]|uniref:Aftiphilin clathrin-binding box domain-containing protein n=1 Tax=Anguilla anguilla TaxID=7936 RepID=A0A9D3MYG1_ANGAN|nr:hypothetical protein ANANG_G00051070 [Anguilla anguilla]